jgi:hypothetical protein
MAVMVFRVRIRLPVDPRLEVRPTANPFGRTAASRPPA